MALILPPDKNFVLPSNQTLDNAKTFDNHAHMTVKQLIYALGGFDAVAAAFEVGASAVRNWSAWNAIPKRHHLQIYRMCAERGLSFDPERPASEETSGEAA